MTTTVDKGKHIARRKAKQNARKTVLKNVATLLNLAEKTPDFSGDFLHLAIQLGWTCGELWMHNRAIGMAWQRWRVERYLADNEERFT